MARWRAGWGSFALIGVAAALYGIAGCTSKPGLAGLASGAMKSLAVVDPPTPAPDTAFTDAAGRTHTLAEFRGKVTVVNLWATWCAPCVAEMPTLAKLDAATAGQGVAVVPVSVDRPEDLANAEAFIAQRPPLPFYSEPKYALAFAFRPRVGNVPATILIDPQGRVRAKLEGGADWSSPEARRVIKALADGG